jgi:hypothetical protein
LNTSVILDARAERAQGEISPPVHSTPFTHFSSKLFSVKFELPTAKVLGSDLESQVFLLRDLARANLKLRMISKALQADSQSPPGRHQQRSGLLLYPSPSSRGPHRLEAMVGNLAPGHWVVLDEIQKVLALLDEVHRLIERRQWRFALCGSSARKLRRGGANLLAGRASTLSMESFSATELGDAFELDFALDWGVLPLVLQEPEAAAHILTAYVNTYLKEELLAEGLIRKVPPFARFLAVAGQINGQVANATNIARESGVARSTVDTYFSILSDTLVGHMLPHGVQGSRSARRPNRSFFGLTQAWPGLPPAC